MADDYQRRGRFNQPHARDMLGYYGEIAVRAARPLWAGGNPLSWPAAWVFAIRTGLPPSAYDLFVGPHFLSGFEALRDFAPGSFPSHFDLKLGAPGENARFLVSGFGKPRKEAATAIGPRARILVPLNNGGATRVRLVGTATTDMTLRVLWNGDEVARLVAPAAAAIDLTFTVTHAATRRGLNELLLLHDGVAANAEAATYALLALDSLP
jgi:hypothetical protein